MTRTRRTRTPIVSASTNVAANPHHPPRSSTALQRLYDRRYFLGDCEGFRDFERSRGKKPSKRLTKCIALTRAQAGENWIDVGCGRGEIALNLASVGATVAALDLSRSALELLRDAGEQWPASGTLRGGVFALRARGEAMPLPSGWAHGIVLSDIVEHMFPDELGLMLTECFRVLQSGGRVVAHTQPNRTLVAVTVPIASRLSRFWGVKLPRDLRDEMTRGASAEYHPNEQTARGLERAFRRAGFAIEELWLEGSYPIHRIFGESRLKQLLLPAFRSSEVLKRLFASQIFCVARKT